jgi:cyclic beta-1,2-glucan synthetase
MNEFHKDSAVGPALPPTAPVSEQTIGLPERPSVSDDALRENAVALTQELHHVAPAAATGLKSRLEKLKSRLAEDTRVCKTLVTSSELTPPLELLESMRMFEAVLVEVAATDDEYADVPFAMASDGATPRVLRIAESYVAAAGGIWSPDSLLLYANALQTIDPLYFAEVLLLPGAIKLAQLEFILDRTDEILASGTMPSIEDSPFSAPIHSLRRLNQFDWHLLLEQITVFNRILAEDPANAFAGMDEESRAAYRLRVANLARHANLDEVETAVTALQMARAAAASPVGDPRLARRMSHVGYYLFEEGFVGFSQRIGYHPPPAERMRAFLKRNNEDIYILSISILSLLLITAFILPIVPHHNFVAVAAALLLALLPATQGASDIINNMVTAIFTPRSLPKLDYQKSIPEDAITLVVVPILLINEAQVCDAIDELEARYLSNPDRNLHFALLTDLPDSQERPQHEDRNTLVELATKLTNELNAKYSHEGYGSFFLLHRHRVFNVRQGVWMGWERKRGKLLDLNKLLMGTFDNFPIKAGPVEVLNKVRYVITLDSDTQLPRGTAARMVGAIAHPLNQAIINPRSRIVGAGYGILQPRVGVSVASASRSRLAALFSGETGFDIYTRAVSDVYQDFFGEGIFTGKGIYEVSILHAVLDRRFPPNFLLSHDLIEGAYARAGLATDIEVIDDYPSHYSAHTRRKHRWVRGDWQIIQWLSNRVPSESGQLTKNPVSLISEWKIFDNLRRSLVEPITFVLLVLGWFILPGGPRFWTIVTLMLLLLPVFIQLFFNVGRAILRLSFPQAADGFRTFFSSLGVNLLYLAFLPHQMLLSMDAIVRSLVRRFVTGKRLLEWETAAQSEADRARSTLDTYLQLSPVVAITLASLLVLAHRREAIVAAPVLALWAVAPAIAGWLNAPPRQSVGPLSKEDRGFLEEQGLLIWRYFAEFGGAENHWLIPDNVEERGLHQVRKLSPTNLGMLINARQAALRLGFLTLPEFTQSTLETLQTYDRLEKLQGHIFNWYDIETLRAISPMVVSTVDSGNLAASLYTLHGGALELLKRPLLDPQPFLALSRTLGRIGDSAPALSDFTANTAGMGAAVAWLEQLKTVEVALDTTAVFWQSDEAMMRRNAIMAFVTSHTPWLLPRFAPLFAIVQFRDPDDDLLPSLEHATEYVRRLDFRLNELAASLPENAEEDVAIGELCVLLKDAVVNIEQSVEAAQKIAREAERHADAMRYGFLLVESRQLLSVGFNGETGELYSSCYDLLASEARIASFLAVAKGDIPQRAWFRLDRTHTLVKKRAALLSWTGTMFEYLMPALWMRNYPDTLITRSLESSVAIQRQHVRGIPWGISESGFAKTDPQGRYSYQAWGIPDLALKYAAEDGPVISPYSSFLAMSFARTESLANLRRMARMGWMAAYGFYEAADYTEGESPQLVRSWMAHHQGMSLLAITNLLCDKVVQQWFHANPRVRAAELLLHERPISRQTLKNLEERSANTKDS